MPETFTIITDGSKLGGGSMPKILAEFRRAVVGRRIVEAGYIDLNGDGQAWPILLLEGGENIVINMDDEGNGPGVPVTSKAKCLCETTIT
jgi:hypothetical protein